VYPCERHFSFIQHQKVLKHLSVASAVAFEIEATQNLRLYNILQATLKFQVKNYERKKFLTKKMARSLSERI